MEGQEALQRDLHRLEHWTAINGMKFNKSKYQILQLGWTNQALISISINWERSGWRVSLQKGLWGCWLAAGTVRISSVSWKPRGQTPLWGASNTESPAAQER